MMKCSGDKYLMKSTKFLICLFAGLTLGCQTTEPSEKFPGLALTGKTTIKITCISKLFLCNQLIKKGGIVTKGKVFDSVTIDVPRREILKLTKIKLGGYRGVTPSVIFQINDENGIAQIFTLNTQVIRYSSFALGGQTLNMENNAHAYPRTEKDDAVLVDFLNYIFF